MACAVSALAQAPQPTSNIPPPPKWPMEFLKDGNVLIVYQPQIRDWNRFRELTSDTAVSITPKGGKPVLGVVSWSATTVTDTQARIVVIKDIQLTQARFPSLDADASAAMEQVVRATFPGTGMTIGLDRLLMGVKMAQEPARPSAISTQPPEIFFSSKPAILLFVDGEPVRVPIEGTKLEYVVNTNWDLLYDKSDYYLLDQKTWLKAKALSGPWTVTTKLPPDMTRLPAGQNWDDVRQAIPPAKSTTVAPRVMFTTKPAELLVFAGEPTYKTIPKTNLAYATNTKSDVFQHSPDHQVYVLISGRWFRAATLRGPWAYASNDLPEDFADLPANDAFAHVLASVPGTQEARDAVLLAQVPTTAIVNRAEAEAKVKVVYSGDPQFKPIEGTSLSYAANTQDRVIKYGDLYYLCFQGVWFMATSANGPWKTADSVPKAIYEIPATSPLYNVTYVTVSNPTPTTVESSYTSGYMGMFVLGAAVGACVAYGTGYYYPPYWGPYWGPYHYPVYYGYPYSYGYRAVYNPTTGFYGVGGAVYGPYGAAGRAAWYNPSTGTYGRAATVQTPYGGRTVAQAYNPWTGTYAATAQGHNAYAQWGSSVVTQGNDWARTAHVTTANGGTAGYRTSDGGAGRVVYGPQGAAGVAKTANDDIYAGKDGNVYKRNPNGSWSKYDNGNWTPVDKPTGGQNKTAGGDSTLKSRQGTAPSQTTADVQQRAQNAGVAQGQRPSSASPETMQQLNQEAASRRQGAAREQTFSRGTGAARYGGGRRR
ncbi:MAG: hypothetical protein ABSD63_16405 [Candidatus Korobacteraceae bacterium]